MESTVDKNEHLIVYDIMSIKKVHMKKKPRRNGFEI